MPSGYTRIIMEATGCDEATAGKLEEIMRNVIFHSTLDWQTHEELQEAARTAYLVLQELEGTERPRRPRRRAR
jgi:hypothetical protein